jgi:transposase-like protein
MPILKGRVLEESDIYTDGWKAYDGLLTSHAARTRRIPHALRRATNDLATSGFEPAPLARWLPQDARNIIRITPGIEGALHRHKHVRYGSMGVHQAWKMRQERKSRCYTTRWNELLVVGS